MSKEYPGPGPSQIKRKRKWENRHKKAAQYAQNKIVRASNNAGKK